MQAPATTSTRPYLVRAMYDWCVDNNCTPFIVVQVDGSVRVPQEFVQNGEIVLNVSLGATSSLSLGNDYIEFKARFGGVAREICVPLGRVSAIYARENGQGMTFPLESASEGEATSNRLGKLQVTTGVVDTKAVGTASSDDAAKEGDPKPPTTPRPSLTRVK